MRLISGLSREMRLQILYRLFVNLQKYPINIFPAVFQVLFTVVIPFGFIGYYPAMYLLGKTKMCVPMWLLAVTLLFALASVLFGVVE